MGGEMNVIIGIMMMIIILMMITVYMYIMKKKKKTDRYLHPSLFKSLQLDLQS